MPGGRPREVDPDEEDRECQKHGEGPHRLHANGKLRGGRVRYSWRCVACRREGRIKKEK